jgi:putative PIN family toxin of toxin-antitoxin system
MPDDLRAVFDTNVIVSAVLLPRSIPRQAFDHALDHGSILVSSATVAELNDVLRREHLNKYVEEQDRLEFLAALVRDAEVIEVADQVTECRDPKDNKFLELGVSGNATHIVTGDQDLLVLHPFRGISVVTPRAFLEMWKP